MTGTRGSCCDRQRLAWFMLLSVAVHAGLMTGGGAAPLTLEAGTLHEAMTVRLDGDDRSARQTATTTPVIAQRPTQTTEIPAGHTELAAVSSEAGEQPTNRPSAEVAARARARVLSDLARHFHYPAIARMRGWQGRVVLAFRVEQDGQLQDSRVAQTSGVGILDEAALHSLRKVDRIAASGTAIDLNIPVTYQLTDTH